MKKAAESAAKWLADKVMGNPKLNPVPYGLFRSIVSKQIEWAAKRGVRFDFTELSEAVRTELLKAGIYTMSEGGRQSAGRTDTVRGILTKKIAPLEYVSANTHSVRGRAYACVAFYHEGGKSQMLIPAGNTKEAQR